LPDDPDVLIAFDCQVISVSDFKEKEDKMIIINKEVIVEINWSAYDTIARREIDSKQQFIKPRDYELLKNRWEELGLNISLEKDIKSGICLSKALFEFDNFLEREILIKNKKICFIVIKDDLFKTIIPDLLQLEGLKMKPYFKCYRNLVKKFST